MSQSAHQHSHRRLNDGHQPTSGAVLDRGWRYDLEVWFFDTFLVGGRIRQLRAKVADAARLSSGHSVLDVGCGTGSQAILSARCVGRSGRVVGIDPAPHQLGRARAKAHRAGLDIDFQPGVIEQIPFPDDTFDVVTSTLMLHHLPEDLKQRGLTEMRRVLKPDGHLVLADFDDNPGNEPAPGSGPDQPSSNNLPTALANCGLVLIGCDMITFPRPHHGWSGISIYSATKPT